MKEFSINKKKIKDKLGVLFLILILFSCNKNEKQIQDTKEVVTTKSDKPLGLSKEKLKTFDLQVDLQKIKEQVDAVTTTFLSRKEIYTFPDRKNSKFYGSYTLIKNDKNGVPNNIIGELIVFDSLNPYIYEKDTDEFVEIRLNKSGINLCDGKLKIGMSLSELLNVLDSDYEIKNDKLIIYSKNDKTAFFKIENGFVVKIRIGIYKDNIDSNKILENW